MKQFYFIFSILVISMLFACSSHQVKTTQGPYVYELQDEIANIQVPASITLSLSDTLITSKTISLQSVDGTVHLPGQLQFAKKASNQASINFLIPPEIPLGTQFVVKANERDAEIAEFRLVDNQNGDLYVYEGSRLVFVYHYGIQLPPSGVNLDRSRSSYIHPLHGLDGEILTEDFPADHYHHRGLYWAWPAVTVGDKTYDQWHLNGLWTRFEAWTQLDTGPVFAKIGLQNGWYLVDRKVATEYCTITVWKAGKKGQVMDVDYEWIAHEPIFVDHKDYKGYGGLNFRFPNRKDPVVSFPEGPQTDGVLKPSPWVDMTGVFQSQEDPSGVSIFVHQDNIDPTPPWLLRTSPTYGFLGLSWPGVDGFNFPVKKPVIAKHRLWIHRGTAAESSAAKAFTFYRKPPKFIYTSQR